MKDLDQKNLKILRAKLEEARDETKRMLGQFQKESEVSDPSEQLGATPDSIHETQDTDQSDHDPDRHEQGTDLYFREQALGLAESHQLQLEDIEHALAKMDNGTYGVSEGNGQPIPLGRLKARPWARYTVEEEETRTTA